MGFQDKNTDEVKPGKKGIALQPPQWNTLTENVEAISTAFEERDDDFQCPLSGEVRVGIFKQRYIDIRCGCCEREPVIRPYIHA